MQTAQSPHSTFTLHSPRTLQSIPFVRVSIGLRVVKSFIPQFQISIIQISILRAIFKHKAQWLSGSSVVRCRALVGLLLDAQGFESPPDTPNGMGMVRMVHTIGTYHIPSAAWYMVYGTRQPRRHPSNRFRDQRRGEFGECDAFTAR